MKTDDRRGHPEMLSLCSVLVLVLGKFHTEKMLAFIDQPLMKIQSKREVLLMRDNINMAG